MSKNKFFLGFRSSVSKGSRRLKSTAESDPIALPFPWDLGREERALQTHAQPAHQPLRGLRRALSQKEVPEAICHEPQTFPRGRQCCREEKVYTIMVSSPGDGRRLLLADQAAVLQYTRSPFISKLTQCRTCKKIRKIRNWIVSATSLMIRQSFPAKIKEEH